MEAKSAATWFLLCIALALSLELTESNVSYDRKALIINGHRKILFSGSIHYPRSTPQVCLYYRYVYIISIFVCFTMFSQYPFGCFFQKCVLYVKIFKMQMWAGLVQKAKDGGLDVIDTYVFWNVHEPSPGNVLLLFLHLLILFLVEVSIFPKLHFFFFFGSNFSFN